MKNYNLFELFGDSAITIQEGQQIFDAISQDLRCGEAVELDFAGVDIVAAPFLNAGIGQLYRNFDAETINCLVKFSNLSPAITNILSRVLENSKRYYTDPVERAAVDAALNTGLEEHNDVEITTTSQQNGAIALLKSFGVWQGDDLQELLKEVRSTRGMIEF